jgi:hypothetical protein
MSIGNGRDRPRTAEEIIEKHGADVLVEMADDGNVGARCVVQLAADHNPEAYQPLLNRLTEEE